MTPHLFIVSIGPVQGFISASRRTRDLWFGSHLLAKISQAAAQAVHDAGGQLIFPVPEALAKSEKEGAQCNIANVLLAELPPDVVPKDVMEAAEKAAKCCWKGYAKAAYDTARKLINPAIWNEQLEDVIEFYAAWVTLPSPDRYADIRKQLMRLLAGRKACRNFLQVQGHAGVPKSSLDGARESVFIPRKRRHDILKEDKKLAQRLRLSRGEELDAVGLIKRAATKEAFSSVVRVAADPWIRGIEKDGGEAKTQLEAIAKECAKVTDYKSEEAATSPVQVSITARRFFLMTALCFFPRA
jgi:CRISPR-associated protein Cmr2